MLIYLAGPMRGLPMYNFPAFFEAAMRLRALKHRVLNPAERDMAVGMDPTRDLDEQAFDLAAAFAWDVESIIAADCVVVLPGWESSRGFALERAVAYHVGTEIRAYDVEHGVGSLISNCSPTISFSDAPTPPPPGVPVPDRLPDRPHAARAAERPGISAVADPRRTARPD